jgi:hypothetical protein
VLIAVVGLLGAPLHAPSAAAPTQTDDGGDGGGGDDGGGDGGSGITVLPTTTTTEAETFTTTANLLVAGDGTEGSETTTTTEVGETQVVGTDGIDDGTLVALIIGGLVVVAVAVAVLTWRYWLATRPVPRGPDGSEPAGEDVPDDATAEVATGSLTPGPGPGSA